MDRLLEELVYTLELINENWLETTKIINSPVANSSSSAHLIKLQGLGFVERIIIDELSPFSKSKWRITKEGKAYKRLFVQINFDRVEVAEGAAALSDHGKIVMTLPSGIAATFLHDHPSVGLTNETLANLFRNAREYICIFSPYIDASISFLMQSVSEDVRVRVISTPIILSNKREIPNPALERLSQNKNLQTRYIRDTLDGVQMYQTHAKLILVDSKLAYIGSANLKETSIFYNLELGCIISEQHVINDLIDIFEDIFTNYSLGRELLQ